MKYNHQILLNLIQDLGNSISRTRLQKILFLFTRLQVNKSYDFIPYKYGCYSFQLENDLRKLKEQGFLKEFVNRDSTFLSVIGNNKIEMQIKASDKNNITKIENEFGSLSINELLKYVYVNYPFYAIKSEIAEKILTRDELKKVEKQKKYFNRKSISSIGYEGRSLENYLKELIINDIKVLVDVRKNPISRKYGFSKKTLSNAVSSIGIKYIHLPELGIESDQRKNLKTFKDYRLLFDEYTTSNLSKNADLIKEIVDIYNEFDRIALTCFENDVKYCHRGEILNNIKNNYPEISFNHLCI